LISPFYGPFSLGMRLETYEPFVSLIFHFFRPRQTADTESVDAKVILYMIMIIIIIIIVAAIETRLTAHTTSFSGDSATCKPPAAGLTATGLT
jgi:uncharacterized membrane protein SpoIIM required for sporulation